MKKLLTLTLVLTMILSLAGCGSTSSSSTSNSSSTNSSASDTNASSDIKTVTEGTLTMGTNAYFPPYEYYEGDSIVGIDAEIAQAVADKLGLTLKIEDMEFDSIITAVTTGKVDIGLAGMTVTEDRKKNVNFSDSYATGVQAIIVKNDSPIKTADDLAKAGVIGVQLGTTGDIYCKDDFGEDHVDEYNKGNDAVMALVSGKVDAVVIDNEPAKSYVAANDGLKILDTEYVVEDYAAAISKDNDALKDAVNKALSELKADGTLDKIIAKYIQAE